MILVTELYGRLEVFEYIGSNTWTVMSFHQLVFFLINLGIFFLTPYFGMDGFDFNEFQRNGWYTYNRESFMVTLLYVVSGIGLPLLLKYWLEKNLSQNAIWKFVIGR